MEWSGIFPIFGGFIPDPDFHLDQVHDFSPEIRSLLNDKNARYQGIDINPWFKDYSSEIILAIEVNHKVYEYRILNSTNPKMRYGFINSLDKMECEIQGRKLVFMTTLDQTKRALLVIDLPLVEKGIVTPIFQGNKE